MEDEGRKDKGRKIRAAAVQMEFLYARSVADYVSAVVRPFRQALSEGAELVAYPEYVTLPLIGLLPGVDSRTRGQTGKNQPQLADVVRFVEPVLKNVYFTLFGALAREAQVHIMAGSTPLPDTDGNVYNVSYLFGPDGRIAGCGKKMHLFPRERHEGFCPGTKLEVFDTTAGRIALPLCMDATYFETYRLAALLGAEIVAAPIADIDPGGYNYWKHLRGAWPRVQESPVYAVQSALVGEFFGESMFGVASIFAPMELTPKGDGILAQCDVPSGSGLAVADLDLEALACFRAGHPVFSRLNLEVVRNYIPQVYERFARQRRIALKSSEGKSEA